MGWGKEGLVAVKLGEKLMHFECHKKLDLAMGIRVNLRHD